jgi:hypothetical protein
MRRVLIAAVATFGLAGIAAAQETPLHNSQYGYAAGVAQNGPSQGVQSSTSAEGVDYSTTSSYRAAVPAERDASATMEIAKRAHR